MGQAINHQPDNSNLAQAAYAQGQEDYAKGQPICANPHYWGALSNSDEGIRRDAWLRGWRDAWFAEDCPGMRWPEMANSLAVIEHRAAMAMLQSRQTREASSEIAR